jgi:hypothetical protein
MGAGPSIVAASASIMRVCPCWLKKCRLKATIDAALRPRADDPPTARWVDN